MTLCGKRARIREKRRRVYPYAHMDMRGAHPSGVSISSVTPAKAGV
jgi:hypothetical protein